MTLAERLADARARLIAAGIASEEAGHDAELLSRHALQWDRARLIAALRDPVPATLDPRFEMLIARRALREPASQIIGIREFWGLDFEISRDVLTPRPETELVVRAALDIHAREAFTHKPVIVDVGTGSGCIAIALATELPDADFIASDTSLAALTVARRNAARHDLERRIAFVHSSYMPPQNNADIIVSNPPYVPDKAQPALPAEVRDYEPSVALFGGSDGLDCFRRLLRDPGDLSAGGWLVVEVGYDQGDAVRALAASRIREAGDRCSWEPGPTYDDLQGIERVLTFKARRDPE